MVRSRRGSALLLVVVLVTLVLLGHSLSQSQQETADSAVAITPEEKLVQQQALVVADGLAGMLSGVAGRAQEQALLDGFVTAARFYDDKAGYFYVYDYDLITVAHPIRMDLEGTVQAELTDAADMPIVQRAAQAAAAGGGWITYEWMSEGAAESMKRRSFVTPIGDTDYFLGTGVYRPDRNDRQESTL